MKLIILDRDGVINEDSPDYIKHPDEWHAIPGSLQAIARLHQAGWRVAIASNQSGLARGLFNISALTAIHQKLRKELAQLGGAIDSFFVCPHGPDDNCVCRKPLPGLFHDIAKRYDIDIKDVPAVGDSMRDIQAASIAGCRPWLVQTGNGPKTLKQGNLPPNTAVVQDLAEAVEQILSNAK
ncbi:D-glycero-beta-D-manno-heptose 1,7-bisphosphate 7-phosphatase [Zwartia sp.]|uniref:D-glycero-beta-D-manno-heptose 1,7-bisphosphate 7-phosphatase n=1 Tax=Zwartia sp. TaxID=2978004 RepID=UPI0027244F99|nr:D-glycero-beta-D-manno-heptose 1,7-bisphosphate 7-phosphatase [Zwartia sp.]MDO9023149.1 D-glycero-beta-D-manno-heptose 1,7-bisphosphate 7-phosphatase [Zwartia sp.]